MTKSSKKFITAFAATTVLALGLYGCGGGGGDGPMVDQGFDDGISASQEPAVYAESASDTLASLLPDGNTVFAPLSAVVERDSGSGRVSRPSSGFAYVQSISSDGANGLRVTYVVNGVSRQVHFQNSDWTQTGEYFVSSEGTNYFLWSLTDSMYRGANRTSGSSEFTYFDMNGWLVETSDVIYEGYSTYGLRTHADNMPTGTATYEGRVSTRVWEGDDPSYPSGRTNVYGGLTLNVDFDNSEVDGLVTELSTQPGDFSAPPEPMRVGNSIDISNGEIVDGQFSADWAGMDTDANSAPAYTVRGFTGTMLGQFYGPAAEEVGGVMNGHRPPTGDLPDQYFTGVFGAAQPDPNDQ